MEMDFSEGNFALRLYKSLKPVWAPRDELDPWLSLLSRNLYSHTALIGANTKKPLRKQRSKPQISEVFGSVSIDLGAYGINPEPP